MKIAVLDDEPALAAQVETIMVTAGHSCDVFHSGRRLLNVLNRETFDLLILDWNVPDFSGMALLQWMRNHMPQHPPVLFVTSRASEEDIVEGLRAGADDYVVKPLQGPVLAARVSAILRRAYPTVSTDPVEHFGHYVLNANLEQISWEGVDIALTAKEFLLAQMLFRNLNRALSRSYIFESLWGRNLDLPTRTLDAHISKVRSKLNLRPERGYRLVPIYAYGYRLEKIDQASIS